MSRRSPALLLALSIVGCAHGHPHVVHRSGSKLNGLVVMEEQPGVRSLGFEPYSVIQSQVRLGHPLDLRLAYTRAAMTALALVEAPRRVLVVGLGGGAMPMFLRRLFPDATIDAVEIDPAVIEVARRFFDFREDRRLHAFAADGRAFVEESAGGYDLIFLDAFGSSDIPRHLTTLEFLQIARARLSPSGVVVGNVFAPSLNPMFGSMIRTYAAAFDQVCAFEVPEHFNWIILARPDARPSIAAELPKAAGLTAAFGLPFEMKPIVERGCMPVEVKGEILRDAGAAVPAPAAAR